LRARITGGIPLSLTEPKYKTRGSLAVKKWNIFYPAEKRNE
jgi:hypothetical protein